VPASTSLSSPAGKTLEEFLSTRDGVSLDPFFEGLPDQLGHVDSGASSLQFEALVQIILPI